MLDVDAILFDLDGTLIDESSSYRETVRLTAEYLLSAPVTAAQVDAIKARPGFNNDWDATWALVQWRRGSEICPPGPDDRASTEYQHLRNVFQTYYLGDDRWRDISGTIPPFAWDQPLIQRECPIVGRETLSWLARGRTGIATSRPRVEAMLALSQHGLDTTFSPATTVAAEDAPREKPDPAPLLALVALLGCVSPVYVGDTVNDALASEAAGMPFIRVGDGPWPEDGIELGWRASNVNEIRGVCRWKGDGSG